MCILASHQRAAHLVRGHFRRDKWIEEHFRSGSFVNGHCQLRFDF